MRSNHKILLVLLGAWSALPAHAAQVLAPTAAPNPAAPRPTLEQRFEFAQLHMGVETRLVVYARDEAVAREACRAAYARIAELEQIASDYRPSSELMQLCQKFQAPNSPPVRVSGDLWTLLQYAQKVSKSSKGAFDVSIGPLVKLWRQSRRTKILASPEALRHARDRVGWKRIVLDSRARAVRLKTPDMQLDLGGIAKGYAGDCALQVLASHGVPRALFESGGDIVASAPPPNERGWKVRLPEGETILLARGALSTSGDTVQWVEIGGRRYSHVLDPRTGLGLSDRWIATVLAPRGITTDALSTAATILGPKGVARLQRDFPGARIWVRRAPEESPEEPIEKPKDAAN
jgi:thiamine biosynthesis lipoprotein